jgi:hypothetical protein
MLFAAYLLFIIVALSAVRANPERWPRYTRVLVRLLTGATAAAAGGVAILLLTSDDADPTTAGVVLLTALVGGSVSYLIGTVVWRGTMAFILRVIGWVLLVVPALVPSTLSLALPILAILALTMSAAPSGDSTRARQARHATS